MTPFEAVVNIHRPCYCTKIGNTNPLAVAVYPYDLIVTSDHCTLKVVSTAGYRRPEINTILLYRSPAASDWIDGLLTRGYSTVDMTDPDSLTQLEQALKECKLIYNIKPAVAS